MYPGHRLYRYKNTKEVKKEKDKKMGGEGDGPSHVSFSNRKPRLHSQESTVIDPTWEIALDGQGEHIWLP